MFPREDTIFLIPDTKQKKENGNRELRFPELVVGWTRFELATP